MSLREARMQNEEIDIKVFLRIINRYKYLIILSTVIFTLASAIYAYFQPNIYRAALTVEVGASKDSKDTIYEAMGSSDRKPGNEIAIIKSRSLTEEALKTIDFTHRYYTTKHFKEIELYKDSPFRVHMTKGYGLSFDLYPVDEKSYRLVIEEGSDGWSYDEVHLYDEEIKNSYFTLLVTRNSEKPFTEAKYRFVVLESEDISKSLVNRISVGLYMQGSTVLEISYHDTVALRAKEFVNALAEAYIQQSVKSKTEAAGLTLVFIEEQLEAINRNLQSSAGKLEDFKTSTNTPDLSTKTQGIISRMSEYETELSKTRIDQNMLISIDAQVKAGKNLDTLSVVGLNLSDNTLSDLIKGLQDTLMQKRILRQSFTEEHPEVTKFNSKIVQLKRTIVNTIKSLQNNIQERIMLLEKLVGEQQKELNTLPASEREYGQLQRKFIINEKIYSYLLEKKSETEIIKAATVSQNRILDAALLPNQAIKPKRRQIVVIGMLLGLLFGVTFVFLREFLDDRIKEEEDVLRGTSTPLLGLIPKIENDNDQVKVFASPKSAVSEAFRHLRTNLNFMVGDKRSQVIAVTSTVGGEGKTTVSINLAAIISMSDKKTIVLNLDMRKPTLHKKFGLQNSQGMSTLLSKHTNLSDVIQHTEYANLDVIASGPVPPNPSELIQSVLMEKVLEKLKEVYDVIILDTPPVGLVTDARTLMHLSDANIYVLRAGYSKKEFLRNVETLSISEHIPGFGILINDIKVNKKGYGYGYYEDDTK